MQIMDATTQHIGAKARKLLKSAGYANLSHVVLLPSVS